MTGLNLSYYVRGHETAIWHDVPYKSGTFLPYDLVSRGEEDETSLW